MAPVITEDMKDAMVGALSQEETYILGEYTKAFERDFASYIGTKHAVAVSSGTAALHLALLAIGVGDNDEVIMAANAYPPVADCIRLVGARPVLVDADERTGCLDPALVEPSITPRTRAVIALHMYGHPVDMDPLLELARQHNLLIVEDCAHALGSRYKQQITGAIGDIAIFSTGRKHITTGGIGGMVTTDQADHAERVTLLRNHGRSEQQQRDMRKMDNVELLGYNYRQCEVLAALGREQLKHLPGWIEERRRNAAGYRERLAALDLPVRPLEELDWAEHSYLHFPLVTERRDELRAFLAASQVKGSLIYPIPVHRMQLNQGEVDVPLGGLPVSERLSSQVMTVPVRPGLAPEQLDYVCDRIKLFFDGS
jgi:dTDP-4-amino-4,6-dideoxygalactose transaminase